MSDRLAELAEDHVRDALRRQGSDLPAFRVDSWSQECVPGEWVIVEDDEGRRSQACLDHRITRGVALEPGRIKSQCSALVRAVLDELRDYVGDGSELIVSRPLPEPMAEGIHVAHMEARGVWLRLTVGQDERGMVAVLAALLGKAPKPLEDAEESVAWM